METVQLFFASYEWEYSNFSTSLFFVERENISYKKDYYPALLLACPCNVPAWKKYHTCSAYPDLGYCPMFLVMLAATHHTE